MCSVVYLDCCVVRSSLTSFLFQRLQIIHRVIDWRPKTQMLPACARLLRRAGTFGFYQSRVGSEGQTHSDDVILGFGCGQRRFFIFVTTHKRHVQSQIRFLCLNLQDTGKRFSTRGISRRSHTSQTTNHGSQRSCSRYFCHRRQCNTTAAFFGLHSNCKTCG